MLLAPRRGEPEELGDKQKIRSLCLLEFGLGLSNCVGLGLLQPLLPFCFVGGGLGAVLLIELEVLVQLRLKLRELFLQLRLFEDLGLLIGVDDAGGDELIDGLALVFGEEGVGFRCVGLAGVS